MNRDLEPSVRAAVLSIPGQAESCGEVVGGPLLGLVGKSLTVRAALVCDAVLLIPALVLYGYVLSQTKMQAHDAESGGKEGLET